MHFEQHTLSIMGSQRQAEVTMHASTLLPVSFRMSLQIGSSPIFFHSWLTDCMWIFNVCKFVQIPVNYMEDSDATMVGVSAPSNVVMGIEIVLMEVRKLAVYVVSY